MASLDRRSNTRLLRGGVNFEGTLTVGKVVIDTRCKRNRVVPLKKLDILSFLYSPESLL
jgi:hypothetical protein